MYILQETARERVVLLTMVHNEARILTRLFRSVAGGST